MVGRVTYPRSRYVYRESVAPEIYTALAVEKQVKNAGLMLLVAQALIVLGWNISAFPVKKMKKNAGLMLFVVTA